jgi:hypothetical protein
MSTNPLSYFVLSAALSLCAGWEFYEVKKEHHEIDEALLQLHEEELAQAERARFLYLEIEELKATRF